MVPTCYNPSNSSLHSSPTFNKAIWEAAYGRTSVLAEKLSISALIVESLSFDRAIEIPILSAARVTNLHFHSELEMKTTEYICFDDFTPHVYSIDTDYITVACKPR